MEGEKVKKPSTAMSKAELKQRRRAVSSRARKKVRQSARILGDGGG